MQYLQKLGKALQFPIVVLPISALLLRLGAWIMPQSIQS
uniref:Hypothetical pts system, nacetyl glucosamine specific component c-terminal truncated transmembrane protein n=1 Tax=Spiroplasma citri TaxID=2133 RepID=Q14MX0_SPICI|nr:hypothetical pts system, nacetyl glucosamine specific component c-terminal truncated transmembrane protein [Spiroplasma citri]